MYRNLYGAIAVCLVGLACACKTQPVVQPEAPPSAPHDLVEPPMPALPPAQEDGVLENSTGYKAEPQSVKTRPQWVTAGEPPAQETGPYYFQGNGEGATVSEASERAESEAKRRIAAFVLANTGFQADTDGAGVRTVKPKTDLQTKEEIEEKQYIDAWIQSGSSFAQAELQDQFWERVKKGGAETVRYWVRYAVTDETIAAVRRDIRNKDAKQILAKETAEYTALKADFKTVSSALDAMSFLADEAGYNRQYEKLLSIDARWKDLTTQRNQPDYAQKRAEIAAAVRYYNPTNSAALIKQEQERLKIEQDIAKNELARLTDRYQTGETAPPAGPVLRLTPLTVGAARIQISGVITNGELLAFLDSADKPDFFGRERAPSASAVNVSWAEAAAYCNWLSVRSGLEPYYRINGTSVQLGSGKNGYRLPSKDELSAALARKIITQAKLGDMGVLGAESNRAYCFDPAVNGLRPLDGAFPTGNIGLMVVRNDA